MFQHMIFIQSILNVISRNNVTMGNKSRVQHENLTDNVIVYVIITSITTNLTRLINQLHLDL